MKILFVCWGNIGRSQIAESVFNKLAQGKHIAVSAAASIYGKDGKSREGLKIADLEASRQKNIVASLQAIGIDISKNIIDEVTIGKVDEADKIIIMADQQTVPDFLKNNPKVTYWEIEDSKDKNQRDTDIIRDQIVSKVQDLLLEIDNLTSK